MFLMIENVGEIEHDLITMLGGTTKKDQSDMIGIYGSGIKYAIAQAMRNGTKLIIYSGR